MRPVEPEDLLALKTVADVQLSPDGRRVAFVLNELDAAADEVRSSIWVVETASGRLSRFTRGPGKDSAPRWSPDGRSLAFLSDRPPHRQGRERPQLYLVPSDGGEARRLTDLEEGAGAATWSPDGRRLAFAARVPRASAPEAEAERARWEQRPRVVTRAQYKADGQGFTFDAVAHLFVVDVADERRPVATQITFGEAEHRGPAWSPDGAQLAFTRDRQGLADYALSDLWVAGADGTGARRVTEDAGRVCWPSWSPDGTAIAFFATDVQEPGLGDPAVRVWTVAAGGGGPAAPQRVGPGDDRSAFPGRLPQVSPGPAWSPDGRSLVYPLADAGSVCLVRAVPGEAVPRPIVAGERWLSSHSVGAGGGEIAFSAADLQHPGDVFLCAADGSAERRLTTLNDAVLDGLALPRVERRRFAVPGGEDLAVDGWLFRAPDAAGPGPLLVHIHGGPHSFFGFTFPFESFYANVLPAKGWSVLALNPSGSGSYSKAFAHRIRGRWGERDLPEQLAAVDALIAEGIADPQRLAVVGYSYGGYMTSWTIGHSERYRAAVVGAPVTNLESFSGTSDIGPWFGAWELGGDTLSREPVRETQRRLSPITYAERVRTPTLIVHGEADDRCPIGQGEEFFGALAAEGRVPVEMVRYPGGAHGFIVSGRPSHRVDYQRRVIDWVERHTRED
ncbi:MAG TPA: S9 family peptidase [Chloroflexota bacterium]|nr:S9 family peptidase [Chloroflexota bacterium]